MVRNYERPCTICCFFSFSNRLQAVTAISSGLKVSPLSLSLSSLTAVGRLSACLARHSGLGKFECHALISWTREEGRSFLPSFLLSFRRPASLLNGRKRSAVLAECCWSRCVKLREGWRCRCRRRRRRVVRVDCGVGVSDQRRSRAAASLASLHFGKRRAGSVTARSNSFV